MKLRAASCAVSGHDGASFAEVRLAIHPRPIRAKLAQRAAPSNNFPKTDPSKIIKGICNMTI